MPTKWLTSFCKPRKIKYALLIQYNYKRILLMPLLREMHPKKIFFHFAPNASDWDFIAASPSYPPTTGFHSIRFTIFLSLWSIIFILSLICVYVCVFVWRARLFPPASYVLYAHGVFKCLHNESIQHWFGLQSKWLGWP